MQMWGGADPGGIGKFGVARLSDDGNFKTQCVSSVVDAVNFLSGVSALGIDAPMWWSAGCGGGRRVDQLLRDRYKISSGTVQSVNSLRGAAVVQGPLLAKMMRDLNPTTSITETHPKALLKALDKSGRLNEKNWDSISTLFELKGQKPDAEDERDALIGAIVAREAAIGRFAFDLSLARNPDELDPASTWFGRVNYWWFEKI